MSVWSSLGVALGLRLHSLTATLLLPAVAAHTGDVGSSEEVSLADRIERLDSQARAAVAEGRFDAAAQAWADALDALPETPSTHRRRGGLVFKLVDAREQAARESAESNRRHLTAAERELSQYLSLLRERYGADASATEYYAPVRSKLEEIRGQLARIPPAPTSQPVPPPQRELEPKPAARDAAPNDSDGSGATPLLAAGGVTAGVGLGLLGGMSFGLVAGSRVDREQPTPSHPAREIRQSGQRWNRVAWATGLVGGAAVVAGAVLVGLGLRTRARTSSTARVVVEQSGFTVTF